MGNLNVVRHVRRIMAGKDPEKPCELLVDGELLLFVRSFGLQEELGYLCHFRG